MARPTISDPAPAAKITFPFGAGWGNVGATWPCTYWKDPATGLVLLEGLASNAAIVPALTAATIGTLPAGYRPPAAQERRLSTFCYTGTTYVVGFLVINAAGAIQVFSSSAMAAGAHVSLDGSLFMPG
jgi:hypothetical protein